ncbi:hypothetical protein LTR10_005119 [Elasticomyces elasticus]|nr:hypothetical protein LTR10_005119 [Elasticomyces elasticus]KAK4975859.1 hypothetical protein LTR42_003480 [Elasticomyces elasticus]
MDSREGSEAPSSEEDFYGNDAPAEEKPAHNHVQEIPNTLMNAPILPAQDHVMEPAQDASMIETTNTQRMDAPAQVEQPDVDGLRVEQTATQEHVHTNGTTNGAVPDDADSSEEMDVSESSRSSPEAQPEKPPHMAAKRKLSDVADTLDLLEQALDEETAPKKPKLTATAATPATATVTPSGSPAERLPTELWQQIFLRLPPAMLSRCLRVSKTFNAYLTQTKAQPSAATTRKGKAVKTRIASVQDSNAIWTEARKNYFSNMPRPLGDMTELAMLQLIGGRTCQFCARLPMPAPATSPFNSGPGPDGMRVIWPFGIRTCGQCLERNTLKDVEILVSPAAALRSGLAYAFRTPDLHFVPEVQRLQPGGIPSHLRVAKVYYKPHIQAIIEEHDEIQGFGDGAAGEWQKGLANKGKEKMADAARWERWEQQLHTPQRSDLGRVLKEFDLASFPKLLDRAAGRSTGVSTGLGAIQQQQQQQPSLASPPSVQSIPGAAYTNGTAVPGAQHTPTNVGGHFNSSNPQVSPSTSFATEQPLLPTPGSRFANGTVAQPPSIAAHANGHGNAAQHVAGVSSVQPPHLAGAYMNGNGLQHPPAAFGNGFHALPPPPTGLPPPPHGLPQPPHGLPPPPHGLPPPPHGLPPPPHGLPPPPHGLPPLPMGLPPPPTGYPPGYVPPNGQHLPYQTPQPHHFQPLPKPVRSQYEVEQARHARKVDIERRCMALQPPLSPSVLQYIDSFQAAMQITTPMNDAQWEMLRPRLIAQRESAELMEHQRSTQLAALQAALPSRASEEAYLKPAKEVYDRDYELAQEPLRKRLGEYADELINGQWHGGLGLDKDTVPSFAVQVLLHVRKRYLEDKAAGSLPNGVNKAMTKQGTPTPDPFLSLDNMKHVHDNKVRPLTDPHRRDIFICAGCAEERKPKWFALEGLVQHYGAKHTTAFSRGNIVVHWQTADWPADPPFHANPGAWVRKGGDFHKKKDRAPLHQRAGQDTFGADGPLVSFNGSPNGHGAYSNHQMPRPGFMGAQRTPSFQSQPGLDPDAQLNQLSTDARELWESLAGVKDLLECVRIHTILHHVRARFTERFSTKPSLDLLTDALATNVLMKPMKNAQGLACKICVAAQTDGSASYQSYYARIRNVKLFNVSSLISHFKIMHQPNEDVGGLDWSKDMIELPEAQLVADLIRTPGMDDEGLRLIAAAFPGVFPYPLPKIGIVTETLPDVGPDSGLANRLLGRLKKKQPQGKKKKAQANGTPREGSKDTPEPGEDEYDPRKPMYAAKEEDPMAKFDSDVARKAAAPPPGPPAFSLAPETLAALNSLTGFGAQPQRAEIFERSPSVGRAEPATPANVIGMPAQAPDISAILASLTGHLPPAPAAAPPIMATNRTSSAHMPAHGYQYAQAQEPPVAPRPTSRHSSGRYAPATTYQRSASPARNDPHDLQSVLAHNARQNQQNHYVQPTYAEAPVYTQAPRSPPRYRYVDEDEQPQQPLYAHPSQPQAPVYGEPAPIQYVQLPEQHRQHVPYGYEQRPAPMPKPFYVDQYGRPLELIPIDAAPAPVQYAPHPYEQQHQQHQYANRPEHAQVSTQYAQAPQYQQVYADGRPMYYEPASPASAPPPNGYVPRYTTVYDDGSRGSVPRG